MTPEQRHAEIVAKYPDGLTPEQFCMVTLESADSDGKIESPSITDWFYAQSLLIGMWNQGLIERRCGPNEAGPWFITADGYATKQDKGDES